MTQASWFEDDGDTSADNFSNYRFALVYFED
jgi:hypothetical protein